MTIHSGRIGHAYFITLCAYQSQPILGQLTDGQPTLTEFGRIAEICWHAIPQHDPHVQIDAYIVMPNHFHGILITDQARRRSGRSPTKPDAARADHWQLSTVLRSFKAAATRRVNHIQNTPGSHLWQPSYHARLIKSDSALNRFRQYIENNPSMWLDDPLNPDGHRPAPFCPVPID